MAARRHWGMKGVIGTAALFAVVLVCVRLGFWQLDRLQQRRALNARVAERLAAPPLADPPPVALADTAAALYRRVRLSGEYDDARSIVLPGRSYLGVPGVHLLTPLRLGADQAVLVNRGWVASADAATIPVDSFPASPPGQPAATIEALVLPLPVAPGSRAAPAPDAGFRRVWYRLEPRALQAQFPYRLLPLELQLLPSPDAPSRPTRLPPPALDEGPHLSYAIQWFSFAAIGIIGWLALLRRSRRTGAAAGLLGLLAVLPPSGVQAQLRPLDPPDWRIFDSGTNLVVGLGGGVLWDQPLTLAGVRGTLLELGSYRLLWRSGRFGLDVTGVAVWRLRSDTATGTPDPQVAPRPGGVYRDPGPLAVATVLRLSPERWSTDLALRFGARIPTTSDESGLERDRTDWFALAGLRWRTAGWELAGETGVGINGTQVADYPQSDALIYSASALRRLGPAAAFATVAGQADGLDGSVRGNEDRSELRAGLRLGSRYWLQTTWVHGLDGDSPADGLLLLLGFATGCRADCLPFD